MGTVKQIGRRRWWLAGTLAAVAIAPVLAQESLLPDGFGDPAPQRPSPAPAPTKRPDAATSPTPAKPASGAFVTETASPASAAGPAGAAETETDDEAAEPGVLRYDLPPGARRLLSRIGPLTPETGGLSATAFGVRGQYVAAIMKSTNAPITSRWTSILLRRALLSAAETPATINGADLAAERAALLLRMGEAQAARLIVHAVDHDRGTPRLAQIAMQTALANADPAGMCPFVPMGLGRSGDENSWRLAAGMCAALSGEPGPAGWAVDKVRSSKKMASFDILLAERVLGATLTGRRSITIQWDGIDRLTSWRFGLATATATPVPDALRRAAPAYMDGWATLAPMTPYAERVRAAQRAAVSGVLSTDAYLALVSAASMEDEPGESVRNLAAALKLAYGAPTAGERLAAMQGLWQNAPDDDQRYAAMLLTARAAAALPVSADVGDDAHWLIGSMLSAGYDRNALAWVPTITVGSRAWGVLAVGLPRQLNGVNADTVDDFASDDDSVDGRRGQLLLAGLAGLGRISAAETAKSAESLGVSLAKETAWTRAIDTAAQRGETGTVALLAATGMQTRDWAKLPPYHLYHIVRALREVGLASEARMIAAEALVRV